MTKKVVETKGSEDTYRTILYSEIEKLLPKNFKILNSIHIKYINGKGEIKKREFDGIILHKKFIIFEKTSIKIPLNAKVKAIIETKPPSSQKTGIKQAYEGSDFLSSLLYFATNFRELFHNLKGDLESITYKESPEINVNNIAKTIIDITFKEKEKIKRKIITFTDAIVVKLLKQCMEFIENELSLIDPKVLEESTGLLWARKLDSRTYESKKKSEELEHDARKAAAYLLLDQLIFYIFLSFNIDKYPKLTKIKDLDEIRVNFNKVLKDDYSSIFGVDIINYLPRTQGTIDTINEVIEIIYQIPFKKFELDILGKIFHGLIPLKIRKYIAAFYTKNESALILAKLSINQWDDEVLDLACGSGTLLTAAYYIKKRLIEEKFTTEHHRKLIDQIYGNDVSIFAAHLATINLAFQNPLAFTNKVNISVGDAFAINPRSLVYSIPAITPKKIDLNGELTDTIRFKKFDIIFMNPPFTRHERMDSRQKNAIIETLKSQGLSKFIDKKMGYNAYFILHSDTFLKINGRLALVLPASTFYAEYGQMIKKFFIAKKYSIDYLIELQGVKMTSFSEDCDFKEFLLVATKGNRKKEDMVKLVTLFRELESEESLKISDQLKDLGLNTKNDLFEIKMISQEELLKQRNWLNAFKKREESSFDLILQNTELLEKLKDSKSIEITSGFHGTYIETLSIPNKYWEIEKDLKDHGVKIKLKEDPTITLTIPRKYLISSFRKPEFYQKIYEEPIHFVINIREDDTVPVNMGKKYLKFFEKKMNQQIEEQIKKGKLRKKLSPFWFCETNRSGCEKNKSRIWIVWKLRLEKRKSFAFFSSMEATAHHAFYRMKLSDNAFNELMISWMNTSFWAYQLFINSRTVAKGLIQLMIKDIIENYVPKLHLIDAEIKDEIVSKTHKLDSLDLPEFPQQLDLKERKELDKIWLKALKVPEELINGILNDLYSYLKEIIIKR